MPITVHVRILVIINFQGKRERGSRRGERRGRMRDKREPKNYSFFALETAL